MVHAKNKMRNYSNRMFEKEYGVNKNTTKREVYPSSPKLTRKTQAAHQKKIQKPLKIKVHQIYIRNLPTWTEKIFITAPDAKSSFVDGTTAQKLVEQRYALSRPGTLRRRFDHQTQRTMFAPTRPNKRSREVIAEIDAKLLRRLSSGYPRRRRNGSGNSRNKTA